LFVYPVVLFATTIIPITSFINDSYKQNGFYCPVLKKEQPEAAVCQ